MNPGESCDTPAPPEVKGPGAAVPVLSGPRVFESLSTRLCLSERRFPRSLQTWGNPRSKTGRGRCPCPRVSAARGPGLRSGCGTKAGRSLRSAAAGRTCVGSFPRRFCEWPLTSARVSHVHPVRSPPTADACSSVWAGRSDIAVALPSTCQAAGGQMSGFPKRKRKYLCFGVVGRRPCPELSESGCQSRGPGLLS